MTKTEVLQWTPRAVAGFQKHRGKGQGEACWGPEHRGQGVTAAPDLGRVQVLQGSTHRGTVGEAGRRPFPETDTWHPRLLGLHM